MESIREKIVDFVTDDFINHCWSDDPEPQTVADFAPYWDEFNRDCLEWGNPVPEGMTVEDYVSIWNDLCAARQEGA